MKQTRIWIFMKSSVMAASLFGLTMAATTIKADTPPAASELQFTLNENGLQSLAYKGQSFLVHPSDGALAVFGRTPIFAKAKEDRIAETVTARKLDPATGTLTHTYPWGNISASYAAVGSDRLDITLAVTNSTDDTLERIMLQVGRMNYPKVPQVSAVGKEPAAFDGGDWYFAASNSGQRPPVVLVDYGSAVLLVAGNLYNENFTAGVFSSESKGMINRAGIELTSIKPGESKTAVLSLRFGPTGSTLRSLGGDILDAYAKAKPDSAK
jgi:hypothetical protein